MPGARREHASTLAAAWGAPAETRAARLRRASMIIGRRSRSNDEPVVCAARPVEPKLRRFDAPTGGRGRTTDARLARRGRPRQALPHACFPSAWCRRVCCHRAGGPRVTGDRAGRRDPGPAGARATSLAPRASCRAVRADEASRLVHVQRPNGGARSRRSCGRNEGDGRPASSPRLPSGAPRS